MMLRCTHDCTDEQETINTNTFDSTTTFNQVCNRLKTISNLQLGYKIWLSIDPQTKNKIFEIDNSLVPSFSRWWYDQSRRHIIDCILEDTFYIQCHFPEWNQRTRDIVQLHISAALLGLGNMRHTYKGDTENENTLDAIIKTMHQYATYRM